MTKRRQYILTVAIGLAVAFVAAVFVWRPVAVELMSRSTAREFREQFAKGKQQTASIEPRDWAWHFGGRAGLGRLQSLAKDESLSPRGRLFAAQLRDMISFGGHLPYLRSILDAKAGRRQDIAPPKWPTIALIEYIYRHDHR
ncbi:hypothetical protein HQ576_08920 [bacterium]|nr:hypothetical protein [bacterium]